MNNQSAARSSAQSRVEIYTKPWCPYCHYAIALLDELGVKYEQYDVASDQERREEMFSRASGRTVPQVFIDEREIGGNDALQALQRAGSLQGLLYPGGDAESGGSRESNQ